MADHLSYRFAPPFQRSRPEPEELRASYESLRPRILAWIRRRLPTAFRDRIDPEDVLQDVWCRVLQKLSRFCSSRCAFSTWVTAIASYVVREAVSKARRAERVRPAGGVTAFLDLEGDQSRFTDRVSTRELAGRLLASLSPLDRKILRLCGTDGLTQRQAADELGLSVPCVEKRWQRLRKKLSGTYRTLAG